MLEWMGKAGETEYTTPIQEVLGDVAPSRLVAASTVGAGFGKSR
jgi:hypothetical protein